MRQQTGGDLPLAFVPPAIEASSSLGAEPQLLDPAVIASISGARRISRAPSRPGRASERPPRSDVHPPGLWAIALEHWMVGAIVQACCQLLKRAGVASRLMREKATTAWVGPG